MKRGVFSFLALCLLVTPITKTFALVSTIDAGGFGLELTYDQAMKKLAALHSDIESEFGESYKKLPEYKATLELLQQWEQWKSVKEKNVSKHSLTPNSQFVWKLFLSEAVAAPLNLSTETIKTVETQTSKLQTIQTNLRIQYLLSQSINRRLEESGSQKRIQVGELDQNTLEGIHSLVSKARNNPNDLENLIQSNLAELGKQSSTATGQDSDFLNALHSSLNDSDVRKAVTEELTALNDPFWGDEATREADARVFGTAPKSPVESNNVASIDLGKNENEISQPLGNFGDLSNALDSPKINAPIPGTDSSTTTRAPASAEQGVDDSARHQNGMKTLGSTSKETTTPPKPEVPKPNLRLPMQPQQNLNLSDGGSTKGINSGAASNTVKTASTTTTTPNPTEALTKLQPPRAEINCVNGNCTEKIMTVDDIFKYEESLRQIRKEALEAADAELAKAGVKREGYKIDEKAISHLSKEKQDVIRTNLATAEEAEKKELASREIKDIQDANESCDMILRAIHEINVKGLGKETHACIQSMKNEIDRLAKLPEKSLSDKFKSNNEIKSIRDAFNRCAQDTAGKPNLRRLAIRNAYRELGVQSFNQMQNEAWKNHSVALGSQDCDQLIFSAQSKSNAQKNGENDLVAFQTYRNRIEQILPMQKRALFAKATKWEEVFKRELGVCSPDTRNQKDAYNRETAPTEKILSEVTQKIDSLKQNGGISQEELNRRKSILSSCSNEPNWFTQLLAQYPKDSSLNQEQGLDLIKKIYFQSQDPRNTLKNNKCLANGVLYQYLQDLQTIYVMQVRNAQGFIVNECFSGGESESDTPTSSSQKH